MVKSSSYCRRVKVVCGAQMASTKKHNRMTRVKSNCLQQSRSSLIFRPELVDRQAGNFYGFSANQCRSVLRLRGGFFRSLSEPWISAYSPRRDHVSQLINFHFYDHQTGEPRVHDISLIAWGCRLAPSVYEQAASRQSLYGEIVRFIKSKPFSILYKRF